MKIGILIADQINAELAPRFGQYPDMFAALLRNADPAIEFTSYASYLGEYPKDIDEVDAYLITGSRHSVYEDKLWIRRLMEFVQTLHTRQKKMAGICFGHQLVAQALGGRTEKSPKGWGMGLQTLQFTVAASVYSQTATNFQVLAHHQDQIVELAPGTTVLAGNDHCPFGMCSLGDNILTFQGHPEFSAEFTRAFFEIYRPQYPSELYELATASLQQAADSKLMAGWIVNFLKGEL